MIYTLSYGRKGVDHWSALHSARRSSVSHLCARLAHADSGSAVSNTISYISYKYGVRSACIERSFCSIPRSDITELLSSIVRDLALTLHSYFGEDRTELRSVLQSICVD